LIQRGRLAWCNGFRNARGRWGIPIFTPVKDYNSLLYKAHARFRIKVENVIAALKDFQILKLPIRERIHGNPHILYNHTKFWVIVAALLNARLDEWETIPDVMI
jgi:hypothetical protein